MKLYFIRHGMTEGNKQKKYVGTTDEPLCPEGIRQIECLAADIRKVHEGCTSAGPSGDRVTKIYISPMRRCLQTADILFPGDDTKKIIIPDFKECDFGKFEYKNYQELSADAGLAPMYQEWIDSGGTLPFPGGENVDSFKQRCAAAFLGIVMGRSGQNRNPESSGKSISELRSFSPEEEINIFVVHGGTIMSVLEAFGEPKKGYYDYQLPCGGVISGDYHRKRRAITNLIIHPEIREKL